MRFTPDGSRLFASGGAVYRIADACGDSLDRIGSLETSFSDIAFDPFDRYSYTVREDESFVRRQDLQTYEDSGFTWPIEVYGSFAFQRDGNLIIVGRRGAPKEATGDWAIAVKSLDYSRRVRFPLPPLLPHPISIRFRFSDRRKDLLALLSDSSGAHFPKSRRQSSILLVLDGNFSEPLIGETSCRFRDHRALGSAKPPFLSLMQPMYRPNWGRASGPATSDPCGTPRAIFPSYSRSMNSRSTCSRSCLSVSIPYK
jgi:hypothetical protein